MSGGVLPTQKVCMSILEMGKSISKCLVKLIKMSILLNFCPVFATILLTYHNNAGFLGREK